MLSRYLAAAMSHATYELLDDGTFYGEVPPLAGVYANANTLEACSEELAEMLEGWVLLGGIDASPHPLGRWHRDQSRPGRRSGLLPESARRIGLLRRQGCRRT